MAAWVPRMAAPKACDDKPNAARRAVAFESLKRVCGAGGMEAAMHAKQRAQTEAITPDQER